MISSISQYTAHFIQRVQILWIYAIHLIQRIIMHNGITWYKLAGHDSVVEGRGNRDEERRKGKEGKGKKEGERGKNVQDSPGECIYIERYIRVVYTN